MLAYYSTIIKKEEIMNRISLDAAQLTTAINDMICNAKTLTVISKEKNIEDSLEIGNQMDEQLKVVNAMISNIRSNLESYAKSLLPEVLEKTKEEMQQAQEPEKPKQVGPDQITTLVESLKTLKAMQESMTHGS